MTDPLVEVAAPLHRDFNLTLTDILAIVSQCRREFDTATRPHFPNSSNALPGNA